jgi:hypothetical protein
MLLGFLSILMDMPARTVTKPIAPGVEYVQEIRSDPPLVVHALRVTLGKDKAAARVALGGDYVLLDDATKGREPVWRTSARRGAVAALNGDFFPWTGDPLGMCVVDGEVVSEPARGRAVFGWSSDGTFYMGNPTFAASVTAPDGTEFAIDGINRECRENENVLWLPSGGGQALCAQGARAAVFRGLGRPLRFGEPAQAVLSGTRDQAKAVPIPPDGAVLFLRRASPALPDPEAGDAVCTFVLSVKDGVHWGRADFAIGGGPWLVRGGKPAVDGAAQGFDSDFVGKRHPRSAIGHTLDGELLLVAVEGRAEASVGATLAEMAQVMLHLGALTAMNLDGGGSTEMVVRGITVSYPSDGASRPVANSVLIYSDWKERVATKLVLEPKVARLAVGDRMEWDVIDTRTGAALPKSHVLWGCTPGVARIDQFGGLTALKPGTTVVSAYCHGNVLRSVVLVAAKTASKLEPAPSFCGILE